jgi:hypothetical protein
MLRSNRRTFYAKPMETDNLVRYALHLVFYPTVSSCVKFMSENFRCVAFLSSQVLDQYYHGEFPISER